MAYHFNFFVLIVYCFAVSQVTGQNCRPEPVRNMQINDDAILSWDPAPNENCNIAFYLVQIDNGETDQRTVTSQYTSTDVSFLPICVYVRFTVIPVSTDSLQGDGLLLYTQVPPPADANLALEYLRLVTAPTNITLQWDIEEGFKNCVTRFRLTIYDVEDDFPADTHVVGYSITLAHLIPCSPYIFGVTALHNLQIEGPVTYLRYTTTRAPPSSPALQRINLGPTWISMTWQLESYSTNRCSISSLLVESLPYFAIAYPLIDQSSRPPVSINLTTLAPDTMYYIDVMVINEAAVSPPTKIYTQTLEN